MNEPRPDFDVAASDGVAEKATSERNAHASRAEPKVGDDTASKLSPAGSAAPRSNSMDPWVRHKQRSQRIREEIARNRRGEYTIPTWGLILILLGLLGVWAGIIWLP
ncbi:hypothetical protein [Natronoglycomyces albus]|uniref:Uncharacterized protein n=1 Tax=Natronoglycomyces albus TaxID=2811108 RepID=A0A895XSW0_9ACTN|nr:hypothetical protein [Natronoglycomyces albus]QSB06742.1 hypothetical protein JQS30_07600 [Natronoglycomyces albus]